MGYYKESINTSFVTIGSVVRDYDGTYIHRLQKLLLILSLGFAIVGYKKISACLIHAENFCRNLQIDN